MAPGPSAIQAVIGNRQRAVIGNRHSTNGDFAYASAVGNRAPPCLRNLVHIIVPKPQQVLENIKNDTQRLLLCLLNARSLRNKSASFVDLVCDSKADLFAVSETWLQWKMVKLKEQSALAIALLVAKCQDIFL